MGVEVVVVLVWFSLSGTIMCASFFRISIYMVGVLLGAMNASTLRLVEDIRRLGVKPGEVEVLEQCEAVTNLVIDPVFGLFSDEGLVEDIKWLQDAHREPNGRRWRNIVELAEALFAAAGGGEMVKDYHALEQPCKDVSDEELALIDEVDVRETIAKIKGIHGETRRRMTALVEQCYDK